jgi:hypothetical protein
MVCGCALGPLAVEQHVHAVGRERTRAIVWVSLSGDCYHCEGGERHMSPEENKALVRRCYAAISHDGR